jgi:hypothetical protein
MLGTVFLFGGREVSLAAFDRQQIADDFLATTIASAAPAASFKVASCENCCIRIGRRSSDASRREH